MSGVIDTNILLYLANRDCLEHDPAREFMATVAASQSQWFLTEGICYEFLRVATHHRVFPAPLSAGQALDFIHTLLAWPQLTVLQPTARHWGALQVLVNSLHHPTGNLFFDLRTATLMRENGVRTIHTADADFFQFPDLTVVNPLQSKAR